jgi:endonuclease YncB( thermonuclease family)
MEEKFKFPTEQIELPSKGLPYSPDSELSKGVIEMKYMSAKEEDILTNQNFIEKGIVIKVYDGDTITIASKLPYRDSKLYRFSVRLNGIDCPEIKGKTAQEKQCAQIAKQEMSDLVLNKMVTLHLFSFKTPIRR